MRILISAMVFAISAIAAEDGFVSIFDGKTLTGWQLVGGRGPGYVVENGTIVCPKDGGGNLYTGKQYGNFIFRFGFKMEPGGNNGVGIRAPLTGDAAYQGMEIQILDHDHELYKGKLKPTQRHGSVFDVFPGIKTGSCRRRPILPLPARDRSASHRAGRVRPIVRS